MRKVVVGQHVVDWVEKQTDAEFGKAVGIGVEKHGEIVGAVAFCAYNGKSMFIHVASNGSRNWVTKEWLMFLFEYAFNQAKVSVLMGPISEKNEDARIFTEHVGFKIAAEIPDAHPEGNLVIYTMTKDECRWLRKRDE